jgi:MFS family permease
MATRAEVNAVYAAGLIQGVALVTFPAASTIFTDPSQYGLSNTQYGTMFLPQVVTAVSSSLLGGKLANRFGIKRVFLAGLVADLASMALLIISQFFTADQAVAYSLLLVATACLGAGFGLTVPAINELTAAFHPDRVDGSVLVLNALLFDSWGRKQMIAGTYLVSGVLLGLSAVMFDAGVLNATTQTIMWVVIFFFASAGASAAYLTVSETWPIEIRAEAIAIFFAIGCVAGALGPAFYGALIGNGSSRTGLFWGYLIGAGIMVIGGLVEIFLGVNAAGKSLEQVTKPLTAVSEEAAVPATTVAPTAPARPATA